MAQVKLLHLLTNPILEAILGVQILIRKHMGKQEDKEEVDRAREEDRVGSSNSNNSMDKEGRTLV